MEQRRNMSLIKRITLFLTSIALGFTMMCMTTGCAQETQNENTSNTSTIQNTDIPTPTQLLVGDWDMTIQTNKQSFEYITGTLHIKSDGTITAESDTSLLTMVNMKGEWKEINPQESSSSDATSYSIFLSAKDKIFQTELLDQFYNTKQPINITIPNDIYLTQLAGEYQASLNDQTYNVELLGNGDITVSEQKSNNDENSDTTSQQNDVATYTANIDAPEKITLNLQSNDSAWSVSLSKKN